jgi:hypothetical protein
LVAAGGLQHLPGIRRHQHAADRPHHPAEPDHRSHRWMVETMRVKLVPSGSEVRVRRFAYQAL